jgi:hypothetical protein
MGLIVYLFAGPQDYRAFGDYCRSLGLRMYPILLHQPEELPTDDPSQYPFCYLSQVPREELHPYGDPQGISSAADPLLDLMKPYFRDNTLVIGRLYCSDDVPRLFAVTKPLFSKLEKWIRKKWHKLPTGQYIGPEAKALEAKGANLAYFPPGVAVEVK